MNTSLTILLILVVLAGIVVLYDHLSFGAERFTISVRDLPNIAADTAAAMADLNEVVTSPGARS